MDATVVSKFMRESGEFSKDEFFDVAADFGLHVKHKNGSDNIGE